MGLKYEFGFESSGSWMFSEHDEQVDEYLTEVMSRS
jgi:hypothetical protein